MRPRCLWNSWQLTARCWVWGGAGCAPPAELLLSPGMGGVEGLGEGTVSAALAQRPGEWGREEGGRGLALGGWNESSGGCGCSSELCHLSCSACLSMESRASMAPAPRALPYYVAFSQLLGLTVVATTGAWLGLYRGGIAWESALQFNVHPLCMVIGLVFLQGDGESRPVLP